MNHVITQSQFVTYEKNGPLYHLKLKKDIPKQTITSVFSIPITIGTLKKHYSWQFFPSHQVCQKFYMKTINWGKSFKTPTLHQPIPTKLKQGTFLGYLLFHQQVPEDDLFKDKVIIKQEDQYWQFAQNFYINQYFHRHRSVHFKAFGNSIFLYKGKQNWESNQPITGKFNSMMIFQPGSQQLNLVVIQNKYIKHQNGYLYILNDQLRVSINPVHIQFSAYPQINLEFNTFGNQYSSYFPFSVTQQHFISIEQNVNLIIQQSQNNIANFFYQDTQVSLDLSVTPAKIKQYDQNQKIVINMISMDQFSLSDQITNMFIVYDGQWRQSEDQIIFVRPYSNMMCFYYDKNQYLSYVRPLQWSLKHYDLRSIVWYNTRTRQLYAGTLPLNIDQYGRPDTRYVANKSTFQIVYRDGSVNIFLRRPFGINYYLKIFASTVNFSTQSGSIFQFHQQFPSIQQQQINTFSEIIVKFVANQVNYALKVTSQVYPLYQMRLIGIKLPQRDSNGIVFFNNPYMTLNQTGQVQAPYLNYQYLTQAQPGMYFQLHDISYHGHDMYSGQISAIYNGILLQLLVKQNRNVSVRLPTGTNLTIQFTVQNNHRVQQLNQIQYLHALIRPVTSTPSSLLKMTRMNQNHFQDADRLLMFKNVQGSCYQHYGDIIGTQTTILQRFFYVLHQYPNIQTSAIGFRQEDYPQNIQWTFLAKFRYVFIKYVNQQKQYWLVSLFPYVFVKIGTYHFIQALIY